MNIRKTTMEDLPRLMEIFQYAREQMKKNGNPSQWGDSKPEKDTIIQDIMEEKSYVVEEDGKVCGTFAFIVGIDPTYLSIANGHWLNNNTYGTIHRIASDGSIRGIFQYVVQYCEKQVSNVRIDTHEDNKIMQKLILGNGFKRCGIIYLADGNPRIAYQLCNE